MTSPHDPHSRVYSHNNGSIKDLLDRFAVSELCKGWPIYRDASEWKNFRSLFARGATVWTTWSGQCTIDEFIELTKVGQSQSVFIQHRECGTLVELGPNLIEDDGGQGASFPRASGANEGEESEGGGDSYYHRYRRAVGKMKATITQRFVDEATGAPFDVDCDCRFVFFCEKAAEAPFPDMSALTGHGYCYSGGSGGGGGGSGGGTQQYDGSSSSSSRGMVPPPPAAAAVWKTMYVKIVYEKDKIVPVDGRTAPVLSDEERRYMDEFLPEGYQYLGVMQRRLGYVIDDKLVTPRNEGWSRIYKAMESWLAGGKADLV